MFYPILTIVLLNLVLYLRVLKYGYVSDDLEVHGAGVNKWTPIFLEDALKEYGISKNPDGTIDPIHREKIGKYIDERFKKQKVREGRLKDLWLAYMGRQYFRPKIEHLITLINYIVACVLIYIAFGANQLSFLAALLFTVNPSNHTAVAWLSGRVYATGLILSLLMWWLAPLAPAWFIVICFFNNVQNFISPLIFFGTKWWMWIFLMLIPLVAPVKLGRDVMVKRGGTATDQMREIKPYKLILFVKFLVYYFFVSILPKRLGLYHTYLYAYGICKKDIDEALKIDKWFWGGVVFSVILGSLIVFMWGTPLSFGLFWWFIHIAPFCHLTTIQQTVSERYLTIPNAGMMYALAWVILKAGEVLC